ncbi:hypothetical protein PYCCODRAFT_1426415 [Trametes coccinea BRFM310]|uniref:Uncharacterized protein n=1 Tax=Trametes coccinea (strain BRFM310) TaxID=1353009 RepID=A0A1Y2IKZ3_TRAC3|nr:hypothetical protein PYCCODRAFT_1426415 [Trametes coccinea BRFM310]
MAPAQNNNTPRGRGRGRGGRGRGGAPAPTPRALPPPAATLPPPLLPPARRMPAPPIILSSSAALPQAMPAMSRAPTPAIRAPLRAPTPAFHGAPTPVHGLGGHSSASIATAGIGLMLPPSPSHAPPPAMASASAPGEFAQLSAEEIQEAIRLYREAAQAPRPPVSVPSPPATGYYSAGISVHPQQPTANGGPSMQEHCDAIDSQYNLGPIDYQPEQDHGEEPNEISVEGVQGSIDGPTLFDDQEYEYDGDDWDADSASMAANKKRRAPAQPPSATQPARKKAKPQADEAATEQSGSGADVSTNDLFQLLMGVAPKIPKQWVQEKHAQGLMQMVDRFNDPSFFTKPVAHDYANFGHSCSFRPDYLTPLTGAFETYEPRSAQLRALVGLEPLPETSEDSDLNVVWDSEPERERIRALNKGKWKARTQGYRYHGRRLREGNERGLHPYGQGLQKGFLFLDWSSLLAIMDQALDPNRGQAALRPRRDASKYTAGWDAFLAAPEAMHYAALVRKAAEDFFEWATATKERRADVAQRFLQMHESGHWNGYKGREFDIDNLLERVCDFLTGVAHLSEGQDDRSRKMTYSSLNTMRAYCPQAKGDRKIHQEWAAALLKDICTKLFLLRGPNLQHCKFVAVAEDLSTLKRPKCYFGPPEILLLIETALMDAERCMENTLQHIITYLILFYTAARPSSIMVTRYYADFYMKYKGHDFSRTCLSYGPVMRLGSTCKSPYVLGKEGMASIHGLRNENHVLLDLGLMVIALGLRRGAFRDYSDLESLLGGKERVLQWKEELKDSPFLCSSTPRGLGVDHAKPVAYPGFRSFLKKLAEKAGLDPYCFRRGTATTMNRVLGSELTKNLLRHKQQSDVLHQHYAGNAQQVDLTAMALYGEDLVLQGLSVMDAPALMRPIQREDPEDCTKSLTLKEALLFSEDLRVLHMQKALLNEISAAGGDLDDAAPVIVHHHMHVFLYGALTMVLSGNPTTARQELV